MLKLTEYCEQMVSHRNQSTLLDLRLAGIYEETVETIMAKSQAAQGWEYKGKPDGPVLGLFQRMTCWPGMNKY
jgi:hypothetical protein